MKINCTLEQFAPQARKLHEGLLSSSRPGSVGGIKRTRLLIRMRPKDKRKTFVLKATDGSTTISSRVENLGQLPLVEQIIREFVTTCTSQAGSR